MRLYLIFRLLIVVFGFLLVTVHVTYLSPADRGDASYWLFAILTVFASAHFTRDQIARISQVPEDVRGFGLGSLLHEIRECLRTRNFRVLVYGIFFLSATLGLHETLTSHISLFFFELDPDQIRFMIIGAPAISRYQCYQRPNAQLPS